MVVLAVYCPSIAEIVGQYGEQLAGRVVVDIANPVEFDTMDGLATPPDSSSAEETARLVPDGTPVVKAFNIALQDRLGTGFRSAVKFIW